MHITISVKETTLTDLSKVFDVIIQHHTGTIEIPCVNEENADKLSDDLGTALKNNGYM